MEKNRLFLQALRGQKLARPPVWFMRQAGRFLPVYQALRKKYSLNHLFHTPELAVEITKMPLSILGVDAAIVFSDILVIGEVLGYRVDFLEKGGMQITPPPTPTFLSVDTTLHYVEKTLRLLAPSLNVPLIGFCGAPYTVGKYLGNTDSSFLATLTDLLKEYLFLQVQAGAEVIQIFDSWAGELEEPIFIEKSMRYVKQLVEYLHVLKVPSIVFCRGSCRYVKHLIDLHPTCISFDAEKSLEEMRNIVPKDIAVQGNLSPEFVQNATVQEIETTVRDLLEKMRPSSGFIFNLGHGVLPHTPVENVQKIVETVKAFS